MTRYGTSRNAPSYAGGGSNDAPTSFSVISTGVRALSDVKHTRLASCTPCSNWTNPYHTIHGILLNISRYENRLTRLSSELLRPTMSSSRCARCVCARSGQNLSLIRCPACNLQTCLNKNTYSPEKCSKQMRELYTCCAKMYDTTNDQGESTACPMPSVTRRWLKSHPAGRE